MAKAKGHGGSSRRGLVAAAGAVLLWGCLGSLGSAGGDGGSSPAEGDRVDAGPGDGGGRDAGPPEAGGDGPGDLDAGPGPDSATPDGVDAGEPDGSEGPDADPGPVDPPPGYPTLLFAATPLASDATFDDFLARAGLTRRWGDSEPEPRYELDDVGGRRAVAIWAREGSRGANGGLLLPGMPRDGVPGGPRESFGRVEAYWHPDYDYNPRLQDASGDWTVREGAGGCKFAGFWGGAIPAVADDALNPGWALTIWTGASFNWLGLGLDLNSPRAETGYAVAEAYRAGGEVWRIDENQGRWVRLEWEHVVEDRAGGTGRVRLWIDGVLGIDREVRYFDESAWHPEAGLKGVYLRNFWGGAGRAPRDTPMYYSNIEVWAR